ncbi:MAG: flagellar hook-length control protein FliK [Lachnospiraceae bacterium]|nr:flagellar hook-length control protein FliK [Lachnospiraceae bacterium]
MAIAPIGASVKEAGLMGMPQAGRKSGSAKEAGKGDFMQAFANAQDQMMPDARTADTFNDSFSSSSSTEGTGARDASRNISGKESGNRQMTDKAQAKKAEPQKAQEDTRQEKAEQAGTSDPAEKNTQVRESTAADDAEGTEPEAAAAAAQQLFLEIAQTLGLTPEELQGTMDELGMEADLLLQPGGMNRLVADVLGGGDISALVTDSSLADMVKELNQLAEETMAQLQEAMPAMEEDALKDALADALAQTAAEAGTKVDTDAAAEAMTQDASQMEGESGEGTQRQDGSRRREHVAHFDEQGVLDAAAQMNAERPEMEPDGVMEAARAETQQLRYTSNPQEIMDQVLDKIKTQVKEDMTSLDMVLHPASLGHVALNLTSRDGAVTAQLTAQNENVREALESQLQILKENLEQAGVKVEAVEVTVSSHAFEQNLEQGNDGQSEAEMQERERLRKATHKINLGDMNGEGAEGLEELGEAEAVNVAMMQADGRRMDYRA